MTQILGDDLAVYGGQLVSLVSVHGMDSLLDVNGLTLSSCVPILFLFEHFDVTHMDLSIPWSDNGLLLL